MEHVLVLSREISGYFYVGHMNILIEIPCAYAVQKVECLEAGDLQLNSPLIELVIAIWEAKVQQLTSYIMRAGKNTLHGSCSEVAITRFSLPP